MLLAGKGIAGFAHTGVCPVAELSPHVPVPNPCTKAPLNPSGSRQSDICLGESFASTSIEVKQTVKQKEKLLHPQTPAHSSPPVFVCRAVPGRAGTGPCAVSKAVNFGRARTSSAVSPAAQEADGIHSGLELELCWIPVIWAMLERWSPHSPALGPYWAESDHDHLRTVFPKAGAQWLVPLCPTGIGGVPEEGSWHGLLSQVHPPPGHHHAVALRRNGLGWARCWRTSLRWGGKKQAWQCPDWL